MHKKGKKDLKETTDQSAFFQMYQKKLKNACLNKYHNVFRVYFQNQCGSRKVSVPSNVLWQC